MSKKQKIKQIKMENMDSKVTHIPEPPFARFLFADIRFAWFWLLVRLYVGWEWVAAGIDKLGSPAWVGPKAGTAVHGFLTGALQKTSGQHPDVQSWYIPILRFADQHSAGFSHLVTYGEILVGAALILGIFTGIAAFAGTFMNINYLWAGAVSINPTLLLLQIFLIMAWRVAGWYGLDHYLLARMGTPWDRGPLH